MQAIIILVAIGAALAVLGVLFQIVVAFFEGAGEAVGSIQSGLVNMLGRRHLKRFPHIPEHFVKDSRPFPPIDYDEANLLGYKPRPSSVDMPPEHQFQSILSPLSMSGQVESLEAQIGSLTSILDLSGEPSYRRFINPNAVRLTYPEAAPVEPKQVPPTPLWTHWEISRVDPSFELPLYGGMFAFLNGYVRRAYATELQVLNEAKCRKAELSSICEARNAKLEKMVKDANRRYVHALAEQAETFKGALAEHERRVQRYVVQAKAEHAEISGLKERLERSGVAGLLARIEVTLKTCHWPPYVARAGASRIEEGTGILIHEHQFPDTSEISWVKTVELKAGPSIKPATLKEQKELSPKLYPSLCIRLAAEIARLDEEDLIRAVVINGWSDFVVPSTGVRKRAYCASLFATKEQILLLNPSKVEPLAAFNALKGVAARSLELTPVAPVMRMDTTDSRFVDPKEILGGMAEGQNLAEMDWEDFEHLCRELFERAFAGAGVEVKVTQASRDQGVDAVVFDPDPLRGGKMVIQAKRYTNTVDVKAVRELFGTVINEGATKGILVTTSQFGPDAYAFAKDKALTLLNGRELLGLLEQHGYKFRIDLAEARKKL